MAAISEPLNRWLYADHCTAYPLKMTDARNLHHICPALCYPWFMVTLFVISGVCARYSLQKQTDKEFLRSKVCRQLILSVAIIFIIGWTSGWVTGLYADVVLVLLRRIDKRIVCISLAEG